jgi:hypothetical protein
LRHALEQPRRICYPGLMEQPTEHPFSLPEEGPTQIVGPWSLYRAPDSFSDQLQPLTQAFEAAFEYVATTLQSKWPLPEGVNGIVILSSEQCAVDWGVDEDALGFHAQAARGQDEETGEHYLDVAEDHRCYINLTGIARALIDDEDDYRVSALATLPHEMAHVALFARHTNGLTPLEVFDAAEDGEAALLQALDMMEEKALIEIVEASHHGASEDIVETFGLDVMYQWANTDHQAKPLIDAIPTTAPARKVRPRKT